MNEKIIFLGDSLTERGDWKNLIPDFNILNYGVSGDKTYQIYNRLPQIIEQQPYKLFFMAGINDLGENRKINKIISDYNLIVEDIVNQSSETKLFLISVLPVNENQTKLKNKNIEELNSNIITISKNKNIEFIDMFNAFITKAGQINSEYSIDGLHLSNAGYVLWKQLIKNFL